MRRLYFIGLFLLSACSGEESENLPSIDQSPGQTLVFAETAEDPEGQPPSERPLLLTMRALGPTDALPERFVIHALNPLFSEEEVGKEIPESTHLKFSPDVAGKARVENQYTVIFTPTNGFEHDTSYTTTLEQIGGKTELWIAEPKNAWQTHFTTPAFAFNRLATQGVGQTDKNSGKRELAVDLLFSGPVDLDSVQERAAFTLDGKKLQPRKMALAATARHVRALFTINENRYSAEPEFSLNLAAGVRSSLNNKLESTARHELKQLDWSRPNVNVHSVIVREGSDGHYLDFVCDDDAVEEKRWWWDRTNWDDYHVSVRCLIEESSVESFVRVTPATDLSVSLSDAGFRLHGAFEQGDLEVTIDAGARTVDGGVLQRAFHTKVAIPERSSTLQFVSKGRYLPRSEWTRLPVRHRNIHQARMRIRHVPAQNLVFWASGQESTDQRTSTLIVDEKIALVGPHNTEATSWVDVRSLLPEPSPGVYELTLEALNDDDSTVAKDIARVVITDLQLVVKEAEPKTGESWSPEIAVWALDIHTNEARSSTEIELVRPSGDVLDRCTTDRTGHCRLVPPTDNVDETAAFALVARRGDDLTYLRFKDLEIRAPEHVHGASYQDESPYRAALYPDRGVYRPGDTAHLTALIRNQAHLAPDKGLPVSLKLLDPRKRLLKRIPLKTNAAGFVSTDIDFADFAVTGRYRAVIEVADNAVGETSFAVEEFVPERLAVEAHAEVDAALATQDVPIAVDARWLFGGKAGGNRVNLECVLAPSTFEPANNQDLHFGAAHLDGEPKPLSMDGTIGTLDDDGKTTLRCPAPTRSGGFDGMGTLIARARVWEGESGRTTIGTSRVPVHPEAYYVGLKSSSAEVQGGDSIEVSGRFVDWRGEAIRPVEDFSVSLYRIEEEVGWIWDANARRSRYREIRRRIPESTQTIELAKSGFSFAFTPPRDADGYLVVARSGRAETELYVSGKTTPWWWSNRETTTSHTPKPQRPEALTISVPDSVTVGSTQKATIETPFAGRLLMTLETDGVLTSTWLDVEAGKTTWPFKVPEFAPNVYVSALLLKDPHAESARAFLPGRAWGAKSVRVEPEAFTQTMKLRTPKEVRPNSKLPITIDLGPQSGPATVTVAAIDAGILSLTDFQSPNPATSIFAKRKLGVRSFETVGWSMLIPPGSPTSSTGGDAAGSAGRIQMVEPVALWSGLVDVPASGRVQIALEVPQYRGELRVMAVAATPERMGSAEKSVTVTEPLVVQATIPRFLVDGDEAQVPVFVSNSSEEVQEVDVTLKVTDLNGKPTQLVAVKGDAKGALSLAPEENGTIVFRLAGHAPTGGVKVVVKAASKSESSVQTLKLPLAPKGPEQREVHVVAFKSDTLNLSNIWKGWVPGTNRSTIQLTHNPYAESLAQLSELLRYPHGCIEQTTSKTRPLLYLTHLLESAVPGEDEAAVRERVTHGINRVLSMQTASGGFGYWPGAHSPHLWGTAYATHMLLDARNAGFDVPSVAVENALDYLQRSIESPRSQARSTAYPHYVLAAAQRGLPARALATLQGLGDTETRGETRYLLQAGLYLSGDRRFEANLRDVSSYMTAKSRANDHYFYGPLREAGLVLSTYRDLFGHDGAQKLTNRVADNLAGRNTRYSTQEIAWAVTGLGKTIQVTNATLPAASLRIANRTLAPTASGWSTMGAKPSDAMVITTKYDAAAPLYAVVRIQGTKKNSRDEIRNPLLSLTRQLLDSDGEVVDPLSVEMGDTLYLRLTLKNTQRQRIANLALTDRVAAGWEIENPRLGGDSLPEWAHTEQLWQPDHMDVRDDRLHVFGTLDAGETREVTYAVRAVTAGVFTQPEARVEAMYDPDLYVRVPGTRVEIAGPWTDELL